MKIKRLIKSLGGCKTVAKLTGKSPATIRAWIHRDSIPARVQLDYPLLRMA